MASRKIVTGECTVKRLRQILDAIDDDSKLVCGVNGSNIGNKLVTHLEAHAIVLEFKL